MCRPHAYAWRLWTRFPLPRIKMPSSRNGASFLPISKWNDAGLFSSMLSWTTGMSASGYTCRSTDQVPLIEPPRVVESYLQRCEQFLYAMGEFGITRRRILHLKQFSREPAEIVNGSRRGGDGYSGF